MKFVSEADLYAPVKAFLENQGYVVKGEVQGCDLVALRGSEPPVVVELKLKFNLSLVLQGIDRLSITDQVYLAVPGTASRNGVHPQASEVRKLCRMLGFGLLTVSAGLAQPVQVLLDPVPYRPRKDAKRLRRLLGEHARRAGDPNRGGVTRTKIVTAYRQQALQCALLIAAHGPMKVAAIRAAGPCPDAARILQDDVYGWFERVERGVYRLTEGGQAGLAQFAGTLPALQTAPLQIEPAA